MNLISSRPCARVEAITSISTDWVVINGLSGPVEKDGDVGG